MLVRIGKLVNAKQNVLRHTRAKIEERNNGYYMTLLYFKFPRRSQMSRWRRIYTGVVYFLQGLAQKTNYPHGQSWERLGDEMDGQWVSDSGGQRTVRLFSKRYLHLRDLLVPQNIVNCLRYIFIIYISSSIYHCHVIHRNILNYIIIDIIISKFN